MWMRVKDKLTKLKLNEGCTTNGGGSLGESPNLMRQLCVPTCTSPQLGLYDLLLSGKLISFRSISLRMGSNSWFGTSSKFMVISLQERKKVWVALHHRQTKWQRLNKSRKLDKHQDETMALNISTCCNFVIKPTSNNSLSTHSF